MVGFEGSFIFVECSIVTVGLDPSAVDGFFTEDFFVFIVDAEHWIEVDVEVNGETSDDSLRRLMDIARG